MNLTLEQIRSVARGVARVEEQDGLISLLRFTEAQELLYKARRTDFYEKTFATAGVVLEFDTDSENLSLSVEVTQASSRKFFVHSVFVNGTRVSQIYGEMEKGETIPASAHFSLGTGVKRVKILFPWSAASRIRALTLDDGSTLTPVDKKRRILLYGDSITHGYDARLPENSYASQLTEWLEADGVNKAIGGEVFCPELAKLRDDFRPDLITVAYGTNDWSKTTREDFETNSLAFYRALRANYPDTPIVALAPIWRADMDLDKPAGPFRSVARQLETVAGEVEGVTLVDCFTFVPQDPQLFADLRLHPNDAGFVPYFAGIRQALSGLSLIEK